MAKPINRIICDEIKRASLERRYWPKVRKGSPDECWTWAARAKTAFGYGRMTAGRGTHLKAHQIGWALANGPIPDGLGVLHECDNPACCNPNHLFLGTQKDNSQDAKQKGRLALPPNPLGEEHPNSKITEELAVAIFTSPLKTVDVARELGVSYKIACDVRNGKSWRHATGFSEPSQGAA